MLPRHRHWKALAVALFLLASTLPAFASGYWNVPSSWAQHMGYGNGGGYHAPLVLGPPNCRDYFQHNHYRIPFSPTPPPYCANYDESFAAPTVLEPAAAPAPVVVPTTRTSRPMFLR